MKEFFGYARTLNTILILVSISLLSFFAFPSKSNNYNRALADVKFLIDIHPSDYRETFLELDVNKIITDNLLIHLHQSYPDLIVFSKFRIRSVIISNYPKSIANLTINELFDNTKYNDILKIAYPDNRYIDDTLNEIFGRNGYQHGSCLPDEYDEMEYIECDPVTENYTLLRANAFNSSNKSAIVINENDLDINDNYYLNIRIKKNDTREIKTYGTELISTMPIIGTYSFKSWLMYAYFNNNLIYEVTGGSNPLLHFINVTTTNYYNYKVKLINELNQKILENDSWDINEQNKRFAEVKKLQSSLFLLHPYLEGISSIYQEIKDMTITQSYKYLLEKVDGQQQSIELAGQKISTEFILLLSPIVLLTLSIALLSSVSMIEKSMKIKCYDTDELLYPWFCLWQDKSSILISYSTINILPFFCFITLILQPSKNGGIDFMINCMLFPLVMTISFLTIRKIKNIRNTIDVIITNISSLNN
ncbi:RNA-binding protein [Klebsiella variicola]|uniref:hypothetical protein n=1 Tax=Klebsiella variicola TaxID=244366 RepID=UPI002ABBD621|nr:hypothetical protein [Klebsiella variicola]MDZ0573245.1 hypothetical protein [Klebsiella variicola]